MGFISNTTSKLSFFYGKTYKEISILNYTYFSYIGENNKIYKI